MLVPDSEEKCVKGYVKNLSTFNAENLRHIVYQLIVLYMIGTTIANTFHAMTEDKRQSMTSL